MEKFQNIAIGVSLLTLGGVLSLGMAIATEPELFQSIMNSEGTPAHNQNDVIRVESPVLTSTEKTPNTSTNILE